MGGERRGKKLTILKGQGFSLCEIGHARQPCPSADLSVVSQSFIRQHLNLRSLMMGYKVR